MYSIPHIRRKMDSLHSYSAIRRNLEERVQQGSVHTSLPNRVERGSDSDERIPSREEILRLVIQVELNRYRHIEVVDTSVDASDEGSQQYSDNGWEKE